MAKTVAIAEILLAYGAKVENEHNQALFNTVQNALNNERGSTVIDDNVGFCRCF